MKSEGGGGEFCSPQIVQGNMVPVTLTLGQLHASSTSNYPPRFHKPEKCEV